MRGGGAVFVVFGIVGLYTVKQPDSLLARLIGIPKQEGAMRRVRILWSGVLRVIGVVLGLIFFVLG